jgi:hypothetical protein
MKFKVGDLVQLSSAGEKRQGNFICRGGFGFVMRSKVAVIPSELSGTSPT